MTTTYGLNSPGCCSCLPCLSGGCTGSTSGGVKNLRLLIIAQNIRNQFKQMLHPRAVLPVRVNKEAISSQVSATVYTFFATYLVCIFVGWTLLMCFGVGLTEAMSTVVSAIGNVGPGWVLLVPCSHGLPYPMRPNGYCQYWCLSVVWRFLVFCCCSIVDSGKIIDRQVMRLGIILYKSLTKNGRKRA